MQSENPTEGTSDRKEEQKVQSKPSKKAPASPAPNYVEKCILGDHSKAVASVKFSVNGDFISSASADASVQIWRTATQKRERTLQGHTQGISDVCWSADNKYIASASDDKLIKLWDVERGNAVATLEGHSNYVFCVNFNNPQTNLLVSGSFDQQVKVWDARTGNCLKTLAAHSDPVTAAEFNRDGTMIVSGSHDGLIRIWDTSTGECLKTIFAEGNPPVSFVRFAPNGKFLLASTLDSTLRLWQTSNPSKCVKTYRGHVNEKYSIFSTFSLTKGKYVVTGSEDKSIYLYDLQQRTVVQKLEGHEDTVLTVAAHPSQDLLVSGGMSKDKTIRLWENTAPAEGTNDSDPSTKEETKNIP